MSQTHDPNCSVCASIDPRISNVQNARMIGTSETSIRRHRRHMSLSDTTLKDEFFDTVPLAAIASRGKTVRLPDGSYEKITYKPMMAEMIQMWSYDEIEEIIKSYKPDKAVVDNRPRRGTMVVSLADFQVGKAWEERGGTPELTKRVLTSFERIKLKVIKNSPSEIILLDLGDGIEGFSNVGSQAQTNDLDLTSQMRVFRRLMIEAVLMFAPLCDRLVFATVPSNHCQVRAYGSKDLASVPSNDFGVEVNYQLEDVFEGRPGYEHVEFVIPDGTHEALTIATRDGTVVGAVHGHQVTKPEAMGSWWKGQSHGRCAGLDKADILLYGHFHSLRVEQSGGRWLFGAPTSDNGSSWYRNKTGEQSDPGMLTFFTDYGAWTDLEVL